MLHSRNVTIDRAEHQALVERRLTSNETPVHFDGSQFPWGISFHGDEFPNGVSFFQADFEGPATSFEECQFLGDICSFEQAQFSSQATSFHGSIFQSKRTSFESTVFAGNELSFQRAVFSGDEISFRSAAFQTITKSFDEAQFDSRKGVFFDEARFEGGELSLPHVRFTGSVASFVKVSFEDSQSAFYRCDFSAGKNLFTGTKFLSPTTVFQEATFAGELTDFSDVLLKGDDFRFNGAAFKSTSTLFIRCKFECRRALFYESIFEGRIAAFDESAFHADETQFLLCEFKNGRTRFVEVEIRGRVTVRGGRPASTFISGTCEFDHLRCWYGGALILDSTDLSRSSFLRADLSGVHFLEVAWHHRPNWSLGRLEGEGRWRSRLRDEQDWREARQRSTNPTQVDDEYLPLLGRLYRVLKEYYRQSGQHTLVGHFHYGLMEVCWHQSRSRDTVSRLARLWREVKRRVSWLWLYRVLAGYGEEYRRVFLWLLLVLSLSGTLYFCSDVPSGVRSAPNLSGWMQAFLYSFQAATLSRIRFYEEGSIPVSIAYVELLESISVPVLFALFVLALRNRFRR